MTFQNKIQDSWSALISFCKRHWLDRLCRGFVVAGILAAIIYGRRDFEKLAEPIQAVIEKGQGHPLLVISIIVTTVVTTCRWLLHFIKVFVEWTKPERLYLMIFAALLFMLFLWDDGQSSWFYYLAMGLSFWFLLTILTDETPDESEQCVDFLNRTYFANRLAEIFLKPNPSIRKVSILGPWGSGKTMVLELLRNRLQREGQFSIAMVNPWKAKTPEEAWEILAKGFDEALDLPPILPERWTKHPAFSWIIRILPTLGVSKEAVAAFSVERQRTKDQLVAKVNLAVRAERRKILILVDDMERADAEILRPLFRVIDQLGEFKECFFVFAIDPEQVKAAFKEDTGGIKAKGYMDKVFDLQIQLPQARQKDVASMIFQKASKGETPKLAEAFPAIFDLISDNPRSALGFFEDARTKEVLFLNRYGHEEEKFCAFFIALICQHEFPDFAEKLMLPEIRESYQTASYVDWMNANSNNSTKDKNLESFHDLLINRLNIEPDSARSNRLKKLTEALVDRASGSDLDWIISGYDKLLELASEERAVLLEVWNVQAGNEPISHMIARRLPGLPFCDEERCAEQLIELEFEEIKKKTQEAAKARALNRRELLKTALAKLEKLHKHLLFAKAESLSADLAPFDEKLFGSWLEYINDIPLDSLESEQDLAQQLHKERTDFHIELAKRFDVFRCWNFAVGEIDRILRLGAYRAPQAEANTHRQLLKKVLYQRVTEEFKKSFRSGEIWQHFPVGFPTAWGLGQLYSPKVWLFTDDEDWKSDLHAFSSEANDDQILAETCARIASAIFLSPLNDPNLSVEDNLYRWRNIKGLAKEFPEYLAFFWNAAMSLEPGNRERLELMEYRRKATEAQAECPEALDLINNHFLVQTIRDSDS